MLSELHKLSKLIGKKKKMLQMWLQIMKIFFYSVYTPIINGIYIWYNYFSV